MLAHLQATIAYVQADEDGFIRLVMDKDAQEQRRELARKKAEGVHLGRPKGALGKHTKLSDKEDVIRCLLDCGNTYAAIARALKVDRSTLVRFCDARGIKRPVNCSSLAI